MYSKSEYGTWYMARKRCIDPKDPGYQRYGGRGIVMCERWTTSFQSFLTDMGQRPSKRHTLDRLNNDGPYSPENCRWRCWEDQQRNRRSNRRIKFNGENKTLAEWAKEIGMTTGGLWNRFNRGWSVERALTTPHTAGKPEYKRWRNQWGESYASSPSQFEPTVRV